MDIVRVRVARFVTLALILGALALFGASESVAAERSVQGRVEQMNKRAMESYDLLEFSEAKKVLLEALDLARKNNLEGELLATTHINLGLVYAAGLKDKERAIGQFVKALEADDGASIDPALASPELQELFDEARERVGGGRRPRASVERSAPSSRGGSDLEGSDSRGVLHKVVEEAPRGRALLMRTMLGSDLQMGKPFLHYRTAGQEEYETLPMSRRGGESYQATIPARAINGRTMHYYIEVEDAKGRSLATNGTPSSPNIVAIVEMNEETDSNEPMVVDEAGADDELVPKKRRFVRKKRLYLATGIGTGFGWATGNTECTNITITPGIAPSALLHAAPEVGYFFTEQFSMALQGRIQAFPGANPMIEPECIAAQGAVAILARAKYLFGRDAFRFYATLAAGGGEIRHTVAIGSKAKAGATDTVAGRSIIVGPGIGFEWDFSNSFGIFFELQTLLVFPTFTANADVNVGFQLRL